MLANREPEHEVLDLPLDPAPFDQGGWPGPPGQPLGRPAAAHDQASEAHAPEQPVHFAVPRRRLPRPLEYAFSPEGAPIVLSVAGAFFWMWAAGLLLWFCTLPLRHGTSTHAAATGPSAGAAVPEPSGSAASLRPAPPPPAPEATEASAAPPSPAPSVATGASPSPAAGPGDAAFHNAAAIRALDGKWRGIAKCRRGKLWGKASTTVTFAGDGSVSRVDVGAPFTGTPTGDCIADALSTVRVEPFADSTAAVVYRVYVAPK